MGFGGGGASVRICTRLFTGICFGADGNNRSVNTVSVLLGSVYYDSVGSLRNYPFLPLYNYVYVVRYSHNYLLGESDVYRNKIGITVTMLELS